MVTLKNMTWAVTGSSHRWCPSPPATPDGLYRIHLRINHSQPERKMVGFSAVIRYRGSWHKNSLMMNNSLTARQHKMSHHCAIYRIWSSIGERWSVRAPVTATLDWKTANAGHKLQNMINAAKHPWITIASSFTYSTKKVIEDDAWTPVMYVNSCGSENVMSLL